MSEPRKKPGVAFCATVVVAVLPLLFVLSVGPADWMQVHGYIPAAARDAVYRFYSPLAWCWNNAPEPFRSAYCWYVCLWDEDNDD